MRRVGKIKIFRVNGCLRRDRCDNPVNCDFQRIIRRKVHLPVLPAVTNGEHIRTDKHINRCGQMQNCRDDIVNVVKVNDVQQIGAGGSSGGGHAGNYEPGLRTPPEN